MEEDCNGRVPFHQDVGDMGEGQDEYGKNEDLKNCRIRTTDDHWKGEVSQVF